MAAAYLLFFYNKDTYERQDIEESITEYAKEIYGEEEKWRE